VRRYLRLYRVFWRNCLARETEFRGNFWANLVTNAGWILFFVLFLKVIYRNTNAIAGWGEGEAFALMGTFGVVQSLFEIVVLNNVSRLPELVRLGTLDFVLTKPVNAQFFVSTRYVRMDAIGQLIGAVGIVLYGWARSGLAVHPAGALAYAGMLLCALAIYYGLYLILMTFSFWFIRLDNLAVLADMLFHVGRYPVQIFRGTARRVFTFVVPVAFMATFPTEALFGRLSPGYLLYAIALAAALLVASTLFWRFGLRYYGSASS
jgi:ABC-2 type transport system permease protein